MTAGEVAQQLFGRPTHDVLDALADIPAQVKIGIYESAAKGLVAEPDVLLAALEPMLSEVRRVMAVARLHLRGSMERAEQRGNAYEAAIARAEQKIGRALAGVQIYALQESGFDPHGFFVYCLWGTDERCPLYVGQSTNILARLGSHLGDSKKRAAVRRVTLLRCKTARQMDEKEQQMIAYYQPPWNTVGIKPETRRSELSEEHNTERGSE